jgi:hypothetical protein
MHALALAAEHGEDFGGDLAIAAEQWGARVRTRPQDNEWIAKERAWREQKGQL